MESIEFDPEVIYKNKEFRINQVEELNLSIDVSYNNIINEFKLPKKNHLQNYSNNGEIARNIFGKNDRNNKKYKEIINYFERLTDSNKIINLNKKFLGGKPRVEGTRIPVSLLVAYFRDEMGYQEIKEDFQLDDIEIKQSLEFVIDILERPYIAND